MKADDDCLSPGGMHSSRLEVQKGKKSKPKKSGRAATPAKYLSRRSVSCCFDGTVTPTVSRLRPRTPCSRSTRRSLSAHCDTPFELYTPVKRSSVSKANKLKALRETPNTSLLPVLLDDKITATGSPSHSTEAEVVKATEKSQPLLDPHKTTTVVQLKSQKESRSPLMTPGESTIFLCNFLLIFILEFIFYIHLSSSYKSRLCQVHCISDLSCIIIKLAFNS